MELVLEHTNGILRLPESTLVIALDDTGHEKFPDPNYPVFGLGGCAFLVRDYQRLIETPWNYMCGKYFPDFRRPMHATDLRKPSKEQLDALNHFYENFQFFRLATTVSINAEKDIEQDYIQIIGASMLNRILDVTKSVIFDRCIILIEESERIELKIVQCFSEKIITGEGNEVKIEIGLIPKSACIPAMEVADMIVHTAGTQTRHRLKGNKTPKPDFEKIFNSVPKFLTSFMEIQEVKSI